MGRNLKTFLRFGGFHNGTQEQPQNVVHEGASWEPTEHYRDLLESSVGYRGLILQQGVLMNV